MDSGNLAKAGEAMERLVDIDGYDHRNQERIQRMRGRVDDSFLKRIEARLAKSATVGAPNVAQPRQTASEGGSGSQAVREEGRKMQALEDLIVQTEIFLQYSLQGKALERLQKIAAMFPGEIGRAHV